MSFLLAARAGRPGFVRYAAGVAAIGFLYLLLSIVVAVVLFGAAGEGADPANVPMLPLGPASPAATIALLLLPSIAVLLGVVAVTRLLLRRPAATLVRAGGRLRWSRALLGAAVWTGAAAAFELVAWLLYPRSYTWTFDPARFLPLLVVAVLLLPLQSAAEELLFRGYLMQGLGLALRRGWAALVVSSAAFGLVHAGNPELQRFGRGFLLYYVFIGLALGLAALLDDGLEVAIGAHTANNLWGALVVSFPGSVLDTPALLRMEGVPPEVMAALGVGVALTSLLVLGILLGWSGQWRRLGPLEAMETAPAIPLEEG
ncbi:MAG TPA: CPBP family glutamic-type intramembrane protease [Thermoanaerobaculia bacterium]|nr:CPBP family glutamic-type intramembrane protease [Thermoanaerobaculia bacterium]